MWQSNQEHNYITACLRLSCFEPQTVNQFKSLQKDHQTSLKNVSLCVESRRVPNTPEPPNTRQRGGRPSAKSLGRETEGQEKSERTGASSGLGYRGKHRPFLFFLIWSCQYLSAVFIFPSVCLSHINFHEVSVTYCTCYCSAESVYLGPG